ncbi:MAG: diaminopropionate ammonia-lyase [Chloroflexi bacterium]|nr:diaminopropionate ammonia-lyase [Chloroflexota bacterium]
MTRVVFNPWLRPELDVPTPGNRPREFHRRLPGYVPSPLVPLPSLAAELGIGHLWLKDESSRFGLPAFKVLGASWAVYREMSARLGGEPDWTTLDDLRAAFASLRPMALATATDGNHGRAVARVARLFGFEARIFVPAGTADARIDGIKSEGATVTVIHGSYDDAVERAKAEAGPTCTVVSDTSWDGYTTIPSLVAEGYSTILMETEDALRAAGAPLPSLVMVQIGVGALAEAVAGHYRAASLPASRRATVVGVEPVGAACVLASIEAGQVVSVDGPQDSIMAGLNCGTPSRVAWPAMRDGIAAFLELEDARSIEAMRRLAAEGVVSGETGASGLGGLIELITGTGSVEARARLGIGPETSVLVISTEGATDPAMYTRLVGEPPESVAARRRA